VLSGRGYLLCSGLWEHTHMERAELPTVRGGCPVWCAPPRKRLRKFLYGKEFVETPVATKATAEVPLRQRVCRNSRCLRIPVIVNAGSKAS
jgi:hypothetical protein